MNFSDWKKNSAQSKIFADGLVYRETINDKCLPVVFRAKSSSLDLGDWYAANKFAVDQQLDAYGGCLFRGFRVRNIADFQAVATRFLSRPAEYIQGATPRSKLAANIYTSTEFPQDQEISLHNELSYVNNPPQKILFCCLQTAEQGGQTQIADMAAVYNKLDQRILDTFDRLGGWMLRRSYKEGFGPSIFKSFKVETIDAVIEFAKHENISVSWVDDHYRTEQINPVIKMHPKNNVPVWFNHVVFWHSASLCPTVKARMLEVCDTDTLPYNTFYGDGSPISDTTIHQIRSVYQQAEVVFDWQEGDLMLLDNLRVAHGRKPFAGPRTVLVSMGA